MIGAMTGIEAIADALASAHRGAPIVAGAPEEGPRNVKEAYLVQEAVLRRLEPGRRPIAWKVSPVRDGSDPLASPVPTAGVLASPATIRVNERVLLGVECEIAFRFGEAPRAQLTEAHDPLESVAEAIVLMELCITRLIDWSGASPVWRLADFQSHGAFVLGSGRADWRAIDYARQEAQLRVDGRTVTRTVSGHATRDLASLVAWTVRHCARRGMPLAAGDIVTTGTWTGLTAVRPVEQLAAIFPDIGEARMRLEH
jgi:2-keto-4-pentenoate hydratase